MASFRQQSASVHGYGSSSRRSNAPSGGSSYTISKRSSYGVGSAPGAGFSSGSAFGYGSGQGGGSSFGYGSGQGGGSFGGFGSSQGSYGGGMITPQISAVTVNSSLLSPLNLEIDPNIHVVRTHEKDQIKTLNNRFASFIDKVGFWELCVTFLRLKCS